MTSERHGERFQQSVTTYPAIKDTVRVSGSFVFLFFFNYGLDNPLLVRNAYDVSTTNFST